MVEIKRERERARDKDKGQRGRWKEDRRQEKGEREREMGWGGKENSSRHLLNHVYFQGLPQDISSCCLEERRGGI